MKNIFLMLVSIVFSVSALAASAHTIMIFENAGERGFSTARMLADRQDSIEFRNIANGPVKLQYRVSKDPSFPSKAWSDAKVIPSFLSGKWTDAYAKVILGDGVANVKTYPECADFVSACVWVHAAVGDYVEFRDANFTAATPIPYTLFVYVDQDGDGRHEPPYFNSDLLKKLQPRP